MDRRVYHRVEAPLRAAQGDTRTGTGRGVTVAEVAGFSVSPLAGFLMSLDRKLRVENKKAGSLAISARYHEGRLQRIEITKFSERHFGTKATTRAY
jgi:hypothetical protein